MTTSLNLRTDRHPVKKGVGQAMEMKGQKYAFRLTIAGTEFVSAWFWGDDQRVAEHANRVVDGFDKADLIEVVR